MTKRVWPPITMATQHPDNAGAPWWKDDAFVATQEFYVASRDDGTLEAFGAKWRLDLSMC